MYIVELLKLNYGICSLSKLRHEIRLLNNTNWNVISSVHHHKKGYASVSPILVFLDVKNRRCNTEIVKILANIIHKYMLLEICRLL